MPRTRATLPPRLMGASLRPSPITILGLLACLVGISTFRCGERNPAFVTGDQTSIARRSTRPDITSLATRRALSEAAKSKIDPTPDELFYLLPRIGIYHVDEGFRKQLTQLYRQLLPAQGDILDLCSQHDSHLPEEVKYNSLTVHGMNSLELLANQRATDRFTQNFNSNPKLEKLSDASIDGATMAVSIQYMQRPVELLADVRRVLRPEGVAIVSFSNRMFFTKATEIWRSQRSMRGLSDLVLGFMREAGFVGVRACNRVQVAGVQDSDPFIAVVGFRDAVPESVQQLDGLSWLPESGKGSIW